MIQSFADKDTEKLARMKRVAKFHQFERIALRKLTQLDVAEKLNKTIVRNPLLSRRFRWGGFTDLNIPPGNRLELLKGDRVGQYSIRINDQYRICFTWSDKGPMNVEICDYH